MGHLLKIKCEDSKVNVHILTSTSVPFTLTTVQVTNLALTRRKRITVHPTLGCPHKEWKVQLTDIVQAVSLKFCANIMTVVYFLNYQAQSLHFLVIICDFV
jgi:hypothetical protein